MNTPMHILEGHGERWYAWFAWKPVYVAIPDTDRKRIAWCEWIERRRFHAADWFLCGDVNWMEYRALPAGNLQ